MNTSTPPRWILATLILAFSCFICLPMKAQTIHIDSLFTSDGEIFPFEPNDTIYGLSISGSITLLSDTSLVRVILTDNNGNEWMVYEAYPFILPNWEIEITECADETKFRQVFNPHSLKIQIINASFDLDIAIFQDRNTENLENLQENYKNTIESRKVDSLNHVIELNKMLWFANRNPTSDLSYKEKEQLFGDKYNLLGLDYFTGGIYDGIPGADGPEDNSELVGSFDWRNRHGANDPSKTEYYYDGDLLGSGWLTSIENQSEKPPCNGLCYIYGPLAAIEGVANLYLNYHKDYNLSEQHVLDCDAYQTDNECLYGYSATTNTFSLDYGVLDETCYPRDYTHGNCRQNSLPNGPPHYRIKITGKHIIHDFDSDMLKDSLINYGPLEVLLQNYHNGRSHFIALVGYGKLQAGDIFYNPSDPYHPIIVPPNSDYIGQLYWIFKNSWGIEYGENGYFYHLASDVDILQPVYYIPPIDDLLSDEDIIAPYDKDKDGYWNWGISEDYDLPYGACTDLKDSDDSENRIGPFDSKYYGTPVKPEMHVTVRSSNPTPITNHGFYFLNFNPETITIDISNPGNAQLNLAGIMPVSIIEEGTHYFTLVNNEQPNSKICMEGIPSSFSVHFETPFPDETYMAFVKIQLSACDSDVYDFFEFALVYNGCSLTGTDYNVTGYEDWREYYLVPNDIYIKRGGIMEVFGSLAMYGESDIYVEPGGQLIVNGGLITGIIGNCRNLWHGIDIWGNPGQTQTLNNQGWVSIINGGYIEYAEIGIETAHHLSPRTWYPSGGIISCTDAVFKDNITDIKFYPYNNTHPVTHQIIPNISRFTRTLFETTDDLFKFNFGIPSTHIFMSQVGGMSLKGCSFGNYSTFHPGSRGMGIESYGAGYFVSSVCAQGNVIPCPEWLPCRFENLDYGIRAFNSNSYYTITVNRAEFIQNLRGIHLRLVQNPTIIRNTFDVSDPEEFWPDDTLVGLYLDEYTTGFEVEENIFTGPSTFSSTVGIHLRNTGTEQNEIYNNSFSVLKQGITAVGINRLSDKEISGVGLCIKCNDFIDCNNDVYVTYELDGEGNPIITENTGIAQKQGENGYGDNTLAAGNTFSDVTSANFLNNEHCGPIDYTYHGTNNTDKIIIPDYFGRMTLYIDEDVRYTKEESCPSHLGGSITPTLEKGALNTETSYISAYQDTLFMNVDGGNTEGLNFEVLTSFPDEALVIRQNLIDESPYLSDTVMISAIEKENVLPGAMIRDVLLINPQAPKSKKIMDALDQRHDTLPDYMLEEIMLGLNTYGAKELLEQELGSHIAKRDKALANLNLYYKNDTANFGAACDSLVALLQNEKCLSAKYDLVFMYVDQADSLNAFNVLDNIPAEFNLSAQELSTHNKYLGLFDILIHEKSDTTGLDSIQIQSLFDLSSAYHVNPCVFASNLLIRERLLNYNEPVYLADILKSAPAPDKKPEIERKANHLSLFPNPAGNYFIVQYDLTDQYNLGILSISDINGKELKAINLQDKQNQIVIPTQEFSAGVYLIRLFGGNHFIESQKVTIIK